MIEFLCPTCKMLFRANDEQGGTKMNCSKCGQRVMVPPGRNKTILGQQVPAPQPASSQALVALPAHPSTAGTQALPAATPVMTYYYVNQGARKGPVCAGSA
jgi:DNA-directed RNA polymerase subunit RPC12/RpoP